MAEVQAQEQQWKQKDGVLILVGPRTTLGQLFNFSVIAQRQQGSCEPLQGMNSLSHLLSHLGFWHLGDREREEDGEMDISLGHKNKHTGSN